MAFYIPKQPGNSDIKSYISEADFRLKDGSLYYGDYHFSSNDNKPYTGKIDSSDMSILYYLELFPTPDYNIYFYLLNKKDFNKFTAPILYIPEPTDDDYKKTFITRYFISRNDSTYPIIEINEKQYTSIATPFSGLDENLYKGITLDWKIYGPKNDIISNGLIIQYGIADTNQRTLNIKMKDMPNIRLALPDLLQFSKIVVF